MKILIIEDNQKLCDSMRVGLEKEGYAVDSSYNGLVGEELAFTNCYDAILLDLNLPDKDGIQILKFLREENIDNPIIIITARDEIKEKVLGLNSGADDYLTKPFEFAELSSRIKAVIRRYNGRSNPDIVLEQLVINPYARKAVYNNKELELSTKEFDALEYIAMKFPKLISLEEIGEHIYNDSYNPFSSVLRVHMMRLKNKVNEAAGYEFLKTIRGKGYSLCLKEI